MYILPLLIHLYTIQLIHKMCTTLDFNSPYNTVAYFPPATQIGPAIDSYGYRIDRVRSAAVDCHRRCPATCPAVCRRRRPSTTVGQRTAFADSATAESIRRPSCDRTAAETPPACRMRPSGYAKCLWRISAGKFRPIWWSWRCRCANWDSRRRCRRMCAGLARIRRPTVGGRFVATPEMGT